MRKLINHFFYRIIWLFAYVLQYYAIVLARNDCPVDCVIFHTGQSIVCEEIRRFT